MTHVKVYESSNKKEMFFTDFCKNILLVDSSPQNSTTRVTLRRQFKEIDLASISAKIWGSVRPHCLRRPCHTSSAGSIAAGGQFLKEPMPPPRPALSIRLQKILLREKATTNNFGAIHSLGKVIPIMEFSDQDRKLLYYSPM